MAAGVLPSCEEGWTRHQEDDAKPPLLERTGWSGTITLSVVEVVQIFFCKFPLVTIHRVAYEFMFNSGVCNCQVSCISQSSAPHSR